MLLDNKAASCGRHQHLARQCPDRNHPFVLGRANASTGARWAMALATTMMAPTSWSCRPTRERRAKVRANRHTGCQKMELPTPSPARALARESTPRAVRKSMPTPWTPTTTMGLNLKLKLLNKDNLTNRRPTEDPGHSANGCTWDDGLWSSLFRWT